MLIGDLTPDGRIVIETDSADTEQLRFIGQHLSLLTPKVSTTAGRQSLELPYSWQAITQLACSFGSNWKPRPALQQRIQAEVAIRTQASDGNEPLATEKLLAPGLTPRPYQRDGARLISATGRVLLADDQGTGKTITAILGLRELDVRAPVVIVAPASVLTAWRDAIATWWPEMQETIHRGPSRSKTLPNSPYDIFIMSYDIASRDIELLRKSHYSALILDECHSIKNPNAKRTKAVRLLADRSVYVVALSGTPMAQDVGDFFPTLSCIAPQAYPSRERWVGRYCLTVQTDYKLEILGLNPASESEFRTSLLGQFRRVSKGDVLTQLPPKVYQERYVTLPPRWRTVYNDMKSKMLATMDSGETASTLTSLTQFMVLRRLALGPCEITNTWEMNDVGDEVMKTHTEMLDGSWKVYELLNVLSEHSKGGGVLVFSESRQLAELAYRAVQEVGYRVGKVVGGQSATDRENNIWSFQEELLDVLVLTTGAGGVGITLTAADTVVFLQRPDSMVAGVQAEDRAHRIGSEHHESITIVDIIAEDTLETRVRARFHNKLAQLSDVVQDPSLLREIL